MTPAARSRSWFTRLTAPGLALALLASAGARAEKVPAAPPAEPAERLVVEEEATAILQRMAGTLAAAKGFSVVVRSGYDVVQPDTGEKIEFGERRIITLLRPDGLRVEGEQSNGRRSLATFDGRRITVFDADELVYGEIELAGTIDDAVRHMVRDLKLRVPLALLLVSTLPEELDQRLTALSYVERDTLSPVPTDHLAGRAEGVDFQIWISTADPPLPKRITLTYREEEGQPQFRADFTDWNLAPDVAAADFVFQPPDGAERIPFLVRVRRTADGAQAQPDAAEGTPK
jgi:hypothetical protein